MENSIPELTEIEIAWLAGLFEGEGSFTLDKRKKNLSIDSPPPSPVFVISMTDLDVMEKVGQLLNQNVLELKRLTTTGLKVYRVQCQNREKVCKFCKILYPFMGIRRKKQISICLDACESYNSWIAQGKKTIIAKKANLKSQESKKKRLSEVSKQEC
jgi:hypothetical protein